MRRSLLGKLNSVNDIYLLRKNLGCRSSCPDHFSVIEITFTCIYTQFSWWERSVLSTFSLLALFFTLILLLTNSLTKCHCLFSLLCMHTFLLVEKKFQFLPGCFLYPVRYQFVCDITLWILYSPWILSLQGNTMHSQSVQSLFSVATIFRKIAIVFLISFYFVLGPFSMFVIGPWALRENNFQVKN